MKVYAVKNGRNKGIYNTWEECEKEVKGFKDAKYKSFSNLEDAKKYLEETKEEINDNIPVAYVDGSYNKETEEYSFGAILLKDGKIYKFKKKFEKDIYSPHRNVSGEVRGAAFIINYAYKKGIKELDLYYDYKGIEEWYQKGWKANTDLTKLYVDFANEVRDKIKVNFHKVKSHSNNKYNDLVDLLAKEALGL